MITNIEVKMDVGCDIYTITMGDGGLGSTTPEEVAGAVLKVQKILKGGTESK